MGDLSVNTVRDYESFRQAFGNELTKASQSFVRIGYLLKRARDERGLLAGSLCKDVYEFAQAEFGLDKSQVSRFMRINDRFSVNGYSEHLQEKYENFGSSKLSLMLLLPDEINEELTPDYSKSDINAIKSEYEAEQKVSDLEVLMEEKDGPDEFIAAVVKELNDEHPEPVRLFHEACEMAKKLNVEADVEDVKEAFMPDGDRTCFIRISGKGKFMINLKSEGITIVNVRDTNEKSPLSWPEFFEALKADMATRDFKAEKEKPKEKPKKVEPSKPKKEVAPVQTAKTLKAEPDVVQNQDNVAQKEPENAQTEEKKPENTESGALSAPTACQPAEPVDVWKDDKQLTAFQKQVIEKLKLTESIVANMETTKENWNKVRDMLNETIRMINRTTF